MIEFLVWAVCIWFLSGILSAIPYFYYVEKRFTVRDIFVALIMGLLGLFAVVINLIELADKVPSTVLWERKETKEKRDDY